MLLIGWTSGKSLQDATSKRATDTVIWLLFQPFDPGLSTKFLAEPKSPAGDLPDAGQSPSSALKATAAMVSAPDWVGDQHRASRPGMPMLLHQRRTVLAVSTVSPVDGNRGWPAWIAQKRADPWESRAGGDAETALTRRHHPRPLGSCGDVAICFVLAMREPPPPNFLVANAARLVRLGQVCTNWRRRPDSPGAIVEILSQYSRSQSKSQLQNRFEPEDWRYRYRLRRCVP